MSSPFAPQQTHADIEIPMPMWHRGPGWYDSSWDLVCGLDIAEVPDLDAWIGVCLSIGSAISPS
ncbi:MAG: hypothetical protein QFE16_05315 [Pseudomonadota bacterium]|nr:hypothetical protein [Pseudomonadota bacterium]